MTTKPLSILDRAFLALDSAEVSAHVAILATFSLPEDASDTFLSDLVADLHSYKQFAPPFNYRLSNRMFSSVAPKWDVLDDEEIDLDFHLRHSALPGPGGQRQLGVLISRLHSRPLDPTRPLWECHVIEGLEGNRFAIYFKVHHALLDGVGGSRRFFQMVTSNSADNEVRPIWTIGPRPRCRAEALAKASVAERAASALRTGRERARLTAELGKATGGIVKDAARPTDPDLAVPFVAPKSPLLNGRIGRQRRYATQTYRLDDLKRIGKRANATVNEVFLAICAGALRKYLGEIDSLPLDGLVTGAPVSVRRDEDDDRGNAIAFVMIKLFTDIEDPVERLRAIQRSSSLAKQNLANLSTAAANQYGVLTNGPYIMQNMIGLAGRVRPPYNLVISNVPGPREQQYLRGARMDELHPVSVIMHGQALNITVLSTGGNFCVGFMGCRDQLPHLQRLAVYTGEAFDELDAALT
ncbi:wax ester/triacylglycerol synthase family O-acyltransferase [Antrihabitans sp. YC2-6]|uniref:WS/DGAT/MGAT family O-acyltransferase n=1 Tax=Antrihabitans sp. YC2-6 TaxID=2799498 RepID=UPI0018F751E1|nr:wax ester/triacylglycerol synthase family O-acyltransferase [Antrihabitans sp. YC2-6]MBJ8344606.1 wax ester/triacylglycerol synthase family O-acyltransferase [Antrihabitans sp. YC2-6]